MANRWNSGWFDVHPRYSAGSPAMVDMPTALSVARDEVKMFEGTLEGVWGPEEQATAQRLGLRGIVEWKQEAGASSIIAYDLLTRTWHLYGGTETTGVYECTRGNFPPIVVVARLGRGKTFMVEDPATGMLPDLHGTKDTEVRDWLAHGRYRKIAPERAQHAHRDVQRQLDEAMEDAGVKA